MSIKKLSMLLLSAMSVAALLNGCGSSSKEGSNLGGVAKSDESGCRVCHADTLDPVSKTPIVADYLTSAHNLDAAGCQGCHGGGAQHNGVGPIPFPDPLASGRCSNVSCHGDGGINKVPAAAVKGLDFNGICGPCHLPPGSTKGIHGAQPTSVSAKSDNCVGCHDLQLEHGPGLVSDNSGVRAIVGEFGKNSHHVTGRAVANADCVICHLEGKANGTAVVVDPLYHMADNKTHLRNANTTLAGNQSKATVGAGGQSEYAWNPASPDHTLMDQYCMSCHNSAGAVTAVAALAGVTPVSVARTVANPFGSGLTNGYDTLVRPAVVAVFEQFDPANTAHHAVRGAKYATRSRATATTANAAKFTQYSGAPTYRTPTGASYLNYSTVAEGKLAIAPAGIGPKYPGSRQTLYDAGLFVAAYIPLGDTLSVADNSLLHCGDCHTVGQFMPGSTTNDKGVKTTVAIGAHGSVNEYMLRNATGADALHHQSNQAATDPPVAVDGTYVCFLCHSQTEEETGGYNAMGFHGGIEGSNSSYCNGRAAESVGLTGFGGTFTTTYDPNGVKTGQTRVPNIIGTNAGGTVFGYSCAHCHNAGQNNTFGGIHGGNATYKSYSTNGTMASRANAGFAIVQKKPYRFLGGLSLKYQGGGDAGKWEAKTLTKANREGCYNQSTVANTATKVKLWGPGAPLDINGVADETAVNPTGANGTWGSCSHHNGSTTSGSGTVPTRAVQRPLSY